MIACLAPGTERGPGGTAGGVKDSCVVLLRFCADLKAGAVARDRAVRLGFMAAALWHSR